MAAVRFMFQFITLVNAQPITMTDEATRLVRDYFVASRRVRPNCLPVTAVGTMYETCFRMDLLHLLNFFLSHECDTFLSFSVLPWRKLMQEYLYV